MENPVFNSSTGEFPFSWDPDGEDDDLDAGNATEDYPRVDGYPRVVNISNTVILFYRTAIPVMLIFCVISIATNMVIVLSVPWVRRHLSPTHSLSISLSAADAYCSFVIGLGLVTNSLLPVGYGVNMGPYAICIGLTIEVFRMTGMIASVLHLLVLAINHYAGIIRPLHYPALVTRRFILFAIALMWIGPFLFFLIYFSSIENKGYQSDYCLDYSFMLEMKFRICTSVLFFVPLFLMAAIYTHIFFIIRQHHRIQKNKHQNKKHFNKNIKAITTTLLILGTYVLGWFPAVVFFLLTCDDCAFPNLPRTVIMQMAFVCNSLIIFKSLVDPIIYAARMKEIRDALKRMRVSCCPCLGQPGYGRDDASSVRSRSDTVGTSLRLHSIYQRREPSVYGGNRNASAAGILPQRSHESALLVKENGC